MDYTTVDQECSTARRCLCVFAVADIIGQPEGLTRFKECVT